MLTGIPALSRGKSKSSSCGSVVPTSSSKQHYVILSSMHSPTTPTCAPVPTPPSTSISRKPSHRPHHLLFPHQIYQGSSILTIFPTLTDSRRALRAASFFPNPDLYTTSFAYPFPDPFDTYEKESVLSLLQMAERSPISPISTPTSSSCSPQQVFSTPGSPFESDITSPDSLCNTDIQDNDSDTSSSEDDSDDLMERPSSPHATTSLHDRPPSSAFTFPMPVASGGKTKMLPINATVWRQPSVDVASRKRKTSPNDFTPVQDALRAGRVSTNTTPSGAFASMNLSSPANKASSHRLESPIRPIKTLPAPSARVAGGSTPPRRAALMARDAISSVSEEENVSLAVEPSEEYEEEYDAVGHSATLSPKSAASKNGVKRKKRRSGGAPPQKKQKFACDDCGGTFTREADMRRHRATACKKSSAVEAMTCQYCQVTFNRGDALNRHIRTKHRNIVQNMNA
ncbi:hypothetical protein BXZ70DRAFT_314238 [Cristinia sonorae]|uniref:C2H2-type domain-containing protein n=1 Tax=Cristinia sonorae TaxID=1940300 RepID=A0A8K0XNX5_9AGAR|nr:hypothetical protein BXZ70DRAFT_314238 [Cristinia sonorae]